MGVERRSAAIVVWIAFMVFLATRSARASAYTADASGAIVTEPVK